MGQKGRKSLKNQPEIHSEVKVRTSIALTPTAQGLLDNLARSFKLSRSEFIELIARGEFEIVPKQTTLNTDRRANQTPFNTTKNITRI